MYMYGKMLRMAALVSLAAAGLFMAITAHADGSSEKVTKDVYAMDTYMQLSAYGEHAEEAVAEAEQEIKRLDAMLSTGRSTSEVSFINGTASKEAVQVSPEVAELMEEALEINSETDGAFDITVYPVMELWGFTSGEYHVPSDEETGEALSHVGSELIAYDADTRTVSFEDEGTRIDFGGIAKGYTSGRIMEIYSDAGVTSGLVSLGGNVQALGAKTDGSRWKIAIQNPEKDGTYLGVLEVENKAVITSGGYERFFEEDGVTYHHIIDPATGRPSDSGLVSVTIVSGNGMMADALSTALFVMGRDRAEEYWRGHSDDFDMVLLTKDGELIASVGLKDALRSDMDVEWIS